MTYFEITKKDSNSRARLGEINTAHGVVNTPAFLPIGTRGAVKAITPEELVNLGADIVLANTYHLWQRPGDELIARAGGLHKFMAWQGPIFTDSGGFQVFSLGVKPQVKEEGVTFRSELNGAEFFLSPEKSIQIQANLGSDIALILDDFPGFPFEYTKSQASIELTKRWAERALAEFSKLKKQNKLINPGQKLWGIVQGANFSDLRERSAQDMVALGFEAFAIGGVAVGEPTEDMVRAVKLAMPHLPENSPKHLLGVGKPSDIVQAVSQGCDTFDCVIPTREARHARIYLTSGETLDIRLEKYKEDFSRVDEGCNCYLCKNYTKAYLRYLFAVQEPLSTRLATLHNLNHYLGLMKQIREAINKGKFSELQEKYGA